MHSILGIQEIDSTILDLHTRLETSTVRLQFPPLEALVFDLNHLVSICK